MEHTATPQRPVPVEYLERDLEPRPGIPPLDAPSHERFHAIFRQILDASREGAPNTAPATRLEGLRMEPQHLEHFLSRQIPPVEWLVDHLVPEAGTGAIVGAEKAGKSLCAAQMALCVSEGLPFLDRHTKQTRVLLVDEEGSEASWQRRFHKLKSGLGISHASNLTFVNRSLLRLNSAPDLATLAMLIHEQQIGLAIVGPLSQVANVEDENKAHEINTVMKCLNLIARDLGATVMVIHHRRKPGQNAPRTVNEFFDSARGSNALMAAVDTALGIDRANEDTDGKLWYRLRDAKSGRSLYAFDPETLVITPREDTKETARTLTTKDRVEEHLFHYPWARVSQMGAALGIQSPTTVNTAIHALEADNAVRSRKSPRARGQEYDLTTTRRLQMEDERSTTADVDVQNDLDWIDTIPVAS